MLLVHHFLWTAVSHGDCICLIVIWRHTLFIAWFCIILAHHSLHRSIFVHKRDTCVLNGRLLLDGNLIVLEWVHVCSLISSCHICISLLSFNDRTKVSKSILTCDIVTLSSKYRIKQFRLRLQSIVIEISFKVSYFLGSMIALGFNTSL